MLSSTTWRGSRLPSGLEQAGAQHGAMWRPTSVRRCPGIHEPKRAAWHVSSSTKAKGVNPDRQSMLPCV